MSATDRLTAAEARRRAGQVSDVSYAIDLDLEAGAKAFRGDVTVTFTHGSGDTFLEWLGGQIDLLEINGERIEPDWDGARISLHAASLEEHNEVRLTYERPFDHTGEGFHQFIDPEDGSEYLYTQFEPYSAHRLFPCFDQPDIKATYEVAVTAPEDWVVVSAGQEVGRDSLPGERSRRLFAKTVPFSTYLMSVCAGPFASVTDDHNGLPLGLHCRASLLEHLDHEALFTLTKRGIDFFGELFDEPYPFGKYDQLFVPEFNWGGMENVAAVTYTDSVVFRDPPTEDQLTRRAEYFMHELAHMWFGDLVTLEWWDDLWLNESFASYVAYLALDSFGDHPSIWQDFNYRMKLWAYREDQLPTTHRIADEVPSTDEVFLNFDGITYGKGAAVLKQLVKAIGPEAFRAGLRTYFKRHRFGNATLADFLAALEEGSGMDLVGWAARWLKTPSLNSISVEHQTADGKITGMTLRQTALEDHPTLRPHHLEIAMLTEGGGRAVAGAVILDEPAAVVTEAEGLPAPSFVYPNHGDHAYAKVALDPASVEWAHANLGGIEDHLLRQQVWASLWEMLRDATLASTTYLDLVASTLPGESSLSILQMVSATVAGAVRRYVPEDRIGAREAQFVTAARSALEASPPGDARVLWARALLGLAAGEDEIRVAAALIDDPPKGLAVDQDMRWSVAVRFAALGLPEAAARLARERERDPSDRGDRAMARAEASRPDAGAKEDVWDRLHGSGYGSLHLGMAAASGFFRRRQRDIVEPFVEQFFEGLPDLFADWEVEAARAYYRTIFPGHRIEASTREMIAGVTARDDIGPMLRRLLVESDDDLRWALECRAVAGRDAGG